MAEKVPGWMPSRTNLVSPTECALCPYANLAVTDTARQRAFVA
jgi:hypothetical protein